MEQQDLLARLISWELPQGPLREPEDIEREMRQVARELGAEVAPRLAALAAALEREQSPHRDVFLEFMDIYAAAFPEALAAGLLQHLSPDGPPLVVTPLGATRRGDASHRLLATLNLAAAGDDLLEALACALGELGGGEAANEALRVLIGRPGLSPRVREEVEIALQNLDGASSTS
jgi:hypothetical protein